MAMKFLPEVVLYIGSPKHMRELYGGAINVVIKVAPPSFPFMKSSIFTLKSIKVGEVENAKTHYFLKRGHLDESKTVKF